MRHVLTPRSKGFVAAVASLGSSLDCIYDMTIAYTTRSGLHVRPQAPSLFGTQAGRTSLMPVGGGGARGESFAVVVPFERWARVM